MITSTETIERLSKRIAKEILLSIKETTLLVIKKYNFSSISLTLIDNCLTIVNFETNDKPLSITNDDYSEFITTLQNIIRFNTNKEVFNSILRINKDESFYINDKLLV